MRRKHIAGAVLLLATAATAQRRWPVHCVDAAGKPVAGAEVWVFQKRGLPDGTGEMDAAGPFTTGEDGIVATVQELTFDGGKFLRWVYARVPDALVGATQQSESYAEPAPQPADHTIVHLCPSRTVRGRVHVPDGVDPTTVIVRVATLAVRGDKGMPTGYFPRAANFRGLATALSDRFDCRADRDGTFAFHDFPEHPWMVLLTEAPGLAQAQWSTVRVPDRGVPDSIELTLGAEASLAGIVRAPDGVVAAEATIRVTYLGPGAVMSSEFVATTDAAGAFAVRGLPHGEFSVGVDCKLGLFRPSRLTLRETEHREGFPLQLETGIAIAGVVVDNDGKPVEGVGLNSVTSANGGDRLAGTRTDPQGRFELRLPTGPAHLYLFYLPDAFDRAASDKGKDLDVQAGDDGLRALRFEIVRKK